MDEIGDTEKKVDTLPLATAMGRPLRLNTNIAVYGDVGSGKTAWTEEILIAQKERLFVLDTTGHDYGEKKFCELTHIRYDAIITEKKDIAAYVSKEKFRIVVRCHGWEMECLNIFQFDPVEQSCAVPNCTVVVEEIHRFMNGQTMETELENIVTLGRHSKINFVGVSQVPRGQTNPLYRAEMQMFVSFRQTEENARKFFADFDSEKAAGLKELERGRYELFRGTNEDLINFINTK